MDSNAIDLLELLRVLWRGRWIIVCGVALTVVVTAAYVFTQTPYYTARALVVVDPERSEFIDMRGAFDTPVAGLESDDISIADEARILRSRRVLERTATLLNLTEHQEFNPTLDDRGGFNLLEWIRKLPRAIGQGGSEGLDGDLDAEALLLRSVVDRLYNRIDIEQSLNSRVIGVETTLEDPQTAAAISNAIAESYIDFQRQDRLEGSRRTVEWMTKRISDLEQQVRRSAEAADTYRLSIGVVDDDRIGALRDRLQRLKRTLEETRNLTSASGKGSESVAQVSDDILEQQAALEISIERTQEELFSLAQSQQELEQYVRQATADRLIYERFLDELKEIDALGAVGYSSARIIETAQTPLNPSGPDKKLAIAIAALIGSVLGLIVILIREILRRGYDSRDELENETGLPVLASLPEMRDATSPVSLLKKIRDEPHSEFAETIRGLRAAILYQLPSEKGRVLALTSTQPNEGKTALSLALAMVATTGHKKAILVDGDLRKSDLASVLDIDAKDYFDDLLFEDLPIERAIYTDKQFGIDVLPVRPNGQSDPNAVDEDAFSNILKQLRKKYELVIVDTPPVTPVFDAGVIARHCDMTLLIVTFAKTKRAAVTDALRRLRDLGVVSAGFVYNRVDFRKEASRRGVAYNSYQEYWRGA
ncbi:GumC family protein [Ovoidimarina sediminis]|uniref:GumC family protein n=1 Tax=Ovoidimarina sediminis TaxID=3079856 RepID=UPI00292FAB75|nr:Wzz/FepE/Etk N-terminal domain-containing protein [Rhodophyticola sp. MJ-SS7]